MGKPSAESFYDRLNHIAGTKKIVKENIDNSTLLDSQKSNEGTNYGIVKENHRYYIKKSTSVNENLDASDFAHIGGIENRHEYEYGSLGEAEKQRNMYIKSLNEAFSLTPTKFISEEKKIDKVENPFDFIKNRIGEGKDFHKKKYENRMKSSLKENVTSNTNKKELMSEVANIAIKKALGLIREEESPLVTSDSEQSPNEILPNKTDKKETPQAPINDSNAKTIADGNKGSVGSAALPNNVEASPESDPFDDKENAGDQKSDIVSQADTTGSSESTESTDTSDDDTVNEWALREGAALVTSDSEQSTSEILPNKTDKKDSPDAPINDTNAKTKADTANTKTGSASLPNNAEASPESDPFTKKEDAGDSKSDIVSESAVNEGEAISTADSEHVASDILPNLVNKKHEPAQAPINDTNAKTKADAANTKTGTASLPNNAEVSKKSDPFTKKEDAGDSKSDIVSEAATTLDEFLNEEALTTADSEQSESEVLPNKKDKKESAQAPINDTNAKTKADAAKTKVGSAALPNNAEVSKESAPFDDKENAGDQKSDIVSEAADALSSILGEGLDDVLDTQADAIDNIPTEEPAPEVAPEVAPEPAPEVAPEMGGDPLAEPELGGELGGEEGGGEIGLEPDMGGDPLAEPELGGEEGGAQASDDIKNEVKSKIGELGEIVRGVEFENNDIVELVNQLVEPFNTESLSHNEQLKIQNKLSGEEGAGEELPPEAEVPSEEAPVEGGEFPPVDQGSEEMEEAEVAGDEEVGEEPVMVGEPAPDMEGEPDLGGEEGDEGCTECGPFDGYASSRGYDDVSSAGGMELANLLSGYANAHGEGQNDGDFGNIIILLTPDVRTELEGYGQDDFLSKADEFGAGAEEAPIDVPSEEVPADEETLSPGSFDIEVPSEPEVEEPVAEFANEEKKNDDESEPVNEEGINELGWRDVKQAGAGIANLGQKAGAKIGDTLGNAHKAVGDTIQKGVDYVGDQVKGAKQTYNQGAANSVVKDIQTDAAKLGQTIANYNARAEKGGGQPVAIQSIMMAINSQIKGGAENIDLSGHKGLSQFGEGGEDFASIAKDVDMGANADQLPTNDVAQATFAPPGDYLGVASPKLGSIGENENKVRDYVKNRLEELAGKRKPTMSESQKPDSLKQLDKMIEEQFKLSRKNA